MSGKSTFQGISSECISKICTLIIIIRQYSTVLHPVSAYAIFRRRMDNLAIAQLSIQAIKSAYTRTPLSSILLLITATCLLHPILPMGDIPLPILFGFLSQDDVRAQKWAVLGRVSSNSQFDNTSTDTQIEEVTNECIEADGTVEHEYELAESGASIHRESLEEIVDKGENGDIDILGVSKFDRLMRADAWEGMEYLKRLKQADVTLYVGTHGYFDYDDMFDFRILVQQILFSRKWFERIRENAKDGQMSKLEKGKWPYGTPGYGYAKDEDDYLYLEDEKEAVLAAILKQYKQKESIETVQTYIRNRFDIEDLPSKSQIGTILDNRLCVGDLMYKERVIRRDPELAVVDRETFQEIREIRQEQRPTSGNARKIPAPVNRAAADFNPEYVINKIDSLGIQCRKCNSDLRKYGTEERWDTTVQKYKCKNEDCGYQGPLLTKSEFKKLHETLPLKCPYCPATERFEVTREPEYKWEFTYECKNCGQSFGSNQVEDIYERAKNNPHLQFNWFQDLRGVTSCDETASEENQQNSNFSDSRENRKLGEFVA